MAERMTSEDINALLLEDDEVDNGQLLALKIAGYLESDNIQGDEHCVALDSEILELLSEDVGADGEGMALDGATMRMLFTNRDGVWKQYLA